MYGKVLLAFVMFASVFAEDCTSPQIKSSVYFTQETALSAEAVVSTTFNVRCSNSKSMLPDAVYVEWNGKIIPAAKDPNGDFQASFTEEFSKFHSGAHTIRVFDEAGYSSFRKAVRAGESIDTIKTLGKIEFENKGVWKGPFVRTDLVVLVIIGIALFLANHQKSKI